MSLLQDQGQRSSGRLPGGGASCAPPPTRGRGASRAAGSYLRVTGPVLRGPAGVLVAVASFAAGGAVGGRAAAMLPGPVLSWYRTGTEAVVYLAILAVGYGLEQAVAARTGRRVLR